MVVFPKAKINIGLRIVSKRNDGYHDIETVFYPVDLHDALEFVPSTGSDELVVTGIDTGPVEQNLVMKALRKLREGYQFPDLRIHLHKAIPSGAGLGGGSSDASCFLKSVIKYFSLPVSDPDLNSIALSIGSDCPFFLSGAPSYATGRGEILEPVDSFLKGHYIVLMNPCLHVSTREAYAGCAPAQHIDKLRELILLPVNEWKNRISNDFETYAFAKYPVIKKIKEMLYVSGAIFSQMSGSGSSVFGIFSEKPQISTEFSQFIIYKGFV
ncbi:MAG TPA: 4-(cytidine 5'-diphospho)-2-C-methyl-D-erythritol kinase [Bacteroidales bacterium]|nr:4-(cytidine 5'-diphospho)-2-C-methyl-D-erythritol kinase [Bacteroidales bacterium]